MIEVGEEDVQEFFESESNPQNHGSAPLLDSAINSGPGIHDGTVSLPSLEHLDMGSTKLLIADKASRILSDEENRVLDDRIDRLIAAIDDGHQLDFAQDPETGNVDISATRYKDFSDAGSLEALIAANVENFGNIIRPGNGRKMLRSENSVIPSSHDSVASSGTNAWERAIAAANLRCALRALEHGAAAQGDTVIKNFEAAKEAAKKELGRYVMFMGKNGPEIRAISPIPLDFNKPRGMQTPSITSNGTEADRSSPLYGKSTPAWLHEPRGESAEASSDGNASLEPRLKHSVSSWLESVEPLPRAKLTKNQDKPERAFGVFNDHGPRGGLDSEEIPRDNPAARALKDISNLRRPGYLAHNSFADSKPAATGQKRILPSRSPAKTFGGAMDPESRRGFIESRWPGLLSQPIDISAAEAPEAHEGLHGEVEKFPVLAITHDATSAAQQPVHPDPIRAANFELALARLEGRAPPGRYSPIKRYAAKKGDYGSSVEVEHRPWPIREPKPTRPFAKVSAQMVQGRSQEAQPRSDFDELGDLERGVGLDSSTAGLRGVQTRCEGKE